MTGTIIKKELILLFLIMLFFSVALASLKIYDSKTGFVQNLGSRIYSSIVKK